MFYKVEATLENNYKDIDELRRLSIEATHIIQMNTNDDVNILLSKIKDSKIELYVNSFINFDFNQGDIQEQIEIFIQACDLRISSLEINRLTNDQFERQLTLRNRLSEAGDHTINDLREFIDSMETYKFQYIKYQEYIVERVKRPKIESFEEVLNQEIKRIKKTKQKKFIGHPTHFKIISDRLDEVIETSQYLTNILYKHQRLIYPYFVEFKFYRDPYDLSKVNLEGINMVQGGSCLFDLSDSIYEEYDNAMLENYLKNLAEIIKLNRHQILFILYSNNKDGRVLRLIEQYLHNIKFQVFTENQIDREKALEVLVETLRDVELPVKLAKTILPKGDQFFIKEVTESFNNWYDKYLNENLYSQYKSEFKLEPKILENKDNSYIELQKMIGLDEVKEIVKDYIDYQKARSIYESKNIELPKISQHMIFTGNPGTAKTSVARLIGKILRENRILSVGDFYEVSRADIVDKYVGWTARNVKNIFRKAAGSVLFIDEAYSLLDRKGSEHSFGDEALAVIVQEMENRKNDIVVIFAGYPKEMEEFLNRNPGLSSRIGYQIDFKDYSTHELLEITEKLSNDYGFTIDKKAWKRIEHNIKFLQKDPKFGNGRSIRNLVEKAIVDHSKRSLTEKYSDQELITLFESDFMEITENQNYTYINYRNIAKGIN